MSQGIHLSKLQLNHAVMLSGAGPPPRGTQTSPPQQPGGTSRSRLGLDFGSLVCLDCVSSDLIRRNGWLGWHLEQFDTLGVSVHWAWLKLFNLLNVQLAHSIVGSGSHRQQSSGGQSTLIVSMGG